MALAGVTENNPEPAIRACLAAIEIRNYMRTETRYCDRDEKRFLGNKNRNAYGSSCRGNYWHFEIQF